jgi:hypothetical protein
LPEREFLDLKKRVSFEPRRRAAHAALERHQFFPVSKPLCRYLPPVVGDPLKKKLRKKAKKRERRKLAKAIEATGHHKKKKSKAG